MKNKKASDKQQRPSNNYLKYTNLAFNMIAALLLGAVAGHYTDAFLQTEPIFTILFLLAAVCLSMVIVIRDVTR